MTSQATRTVNLDSITSENANVNPIRAYVHNTTMARDPNCPAELSCRIPRVYKQATTPYTVSYPIDTKAQEVDIDLFSKAKPGSFCTQLTLSFSVPAIEGRQKIISQDGQVTCVPLDSEIYVDTETGNTWTNTFTKDPAVYAKHLLRFNNTGAQSGGYAMMPISMSAAQQQQPSLGGRPGGMATAMTSIQPARGNNGLSSYQRSHSTRLVSRQRGGGGGGGEEEVYDVETGCYKNEKNWRMTPRLVAYVNALPYRVLQSIQLVLNGRPVGAPLTPETLYMVVDDMYGFAIWDATGVIPFGWARQVEQSAYDRPYEIPLPFICKSHAVPWFTKPKLRIKPSTISELLRVNHPHLAVFLRERNEQLKMEHILVTVEAEFEHPVEEKSAREYASADGLFWLQTPSFLVTQKHSVQVGSAVGDIELTTEHEDPVKNYLVAVRTQHHTLSNRWNIFSLSSEEDQHLPPAAPKDAIKDIILLDSARKVRFRYTALHARTINSIYHRKDVPPTENYIYTVGWSKNINDDIVWDGFSNLVRSAGGLIGRPQHRGGGTTFHPDDMRCNITWQLEMSRMLYGSKVDIFVVGRGFRIWQFHVSDNDEAHISRAM